MLCGRFMPAADAIRLYWTDAPNQFKAVRGGSFEVYVMGRGYKGAPPAEKDPLAVL